MNTWFRKIGMGAVALTLAGVLGGCNNGSGSDLIKLFFGINGGGSCNSVVVEVNLADADAVIERDNDGNLQCELASALDAAGCNISFSEPGGGVLRVTVSGCTINGVSNLFSCLFEDVDISELQQTAEGQCACTNAPGCDNTPPVCISRNADPTSCEDCDNGVDDDDNGLIDCDDPNCSNDPICGPETTTSTTSNTISSTSTSTTNTTSTTGSTTTTTLIGGGLTCHVFLRLADDATLGSLQFDVDYGDAPGSFLGTGGNVECASLIQGSLASFNDKDAEETLTAGIISLDGFTGPVNVADCTFTASVQPTPADFTIAVTEASDPDLNPVEPTPDVVIVSPIECEGNPVTTTTVEGQTTTTEPGVTTTIVGSTNFSVLFRLTSASAAAGALQFHTDYSAAPGGFAGAGAAVNCTSLVSGALFAPNDIEATTTLNLGIISLSPVTAPIDLVRCTFNAEGGTPVPADFPVVIDDATDPDGAPIDAAISVTSVTAIP
ncbi:MAG TPA: hypothetical protein VN634_14380 [Candidatus Limnocylindrales bacterium]|nr:hypothetical protein [Candidatus Limnocylindrales bacterium]